MGYEFVAVCQMFQATRTIQTTMTAKGTRRLRNAFKFWPCIGLAWQDIE